MFTKSLYISLHAILAYSGCQCRLHSIIKDFNCKVTLNCDQGLHLEVIIITSTHMSQIFTGICLCLSSGEVSLASGL